MNSETDISRRAFVTTAGGTGISAFAGCAEGDSGAGESTPEPAGNGTASPGETSGTDARSGLVEAIEREAVPFELTDQSENLDAVATRLADAPVVGIGESSHGVREFKEIPQRLVRRLVDDHGYRLVAMEGTLGEFEAVNAYVTDGEGDLETALSSLQFHFWGTDEIRRLCERLRAFNEGRPEDDRVAVRGFDAQFYDVNATAVRSYLDRVDPEYLSTVEDSLEPLTTPIQASSPSAFATDAQTTLIENLRERLRSHEDEYVEASSRSEWRLARRHVRTLERGLLFAEKSAAEEYDLGKEIRDEAMADNVTWLREWTGADRAVVMGSVNHTMRSPGDGDQPGTRMGQHLADEFGRDYYSLGLTFGTGSFSVPANHQRTEFETYELDGPVDGTLEATLADLSRSPTYLDFEDAREQAVVDDWLTETSKLQVSFPRAPERGAVALPEPPVDLLDGVAFVREVSPASFSLSG